MRPHGALVLPIKLLQQPVVRRLGANTAAARASAAAAGERMRETMAGSFAAMKNLNLGFTRREQG